MKIALVDHDVIYGYARGQASAVGGAERFMWLQTKALAAAGWSAVVGVRSALAAGERVCIAGVDFVGMARANTFVAFDRFLASERPDWCHWFGASHVLGPAVAIAKARGTRTTYSAQFDLDVHPRRALDARPRLWPLYAAGLYGSERIFVQHRRQFSELPDRLKPKAHVIPGVVELPNTSRDHAARRRYVAWVGVLRQPKRPDLLIEIARRSPTTDFVVCGGASEHRSPAGYSEEMIRRLAELPNVHYLGHVPPSEALRIIGDAAVLLSTSDGEGFPSVFLESWASATPVVSLHIDPDLIISTLGLGVLSGVVERAVHDIATFLDSHQKRQQVGDRCREYVARHHSAAAAVTAVNKALAPPVREVWHPTQDFKRP